VKFQLDYVLDFAEPSESLEALSTVPIDMEEAYRLLLTRIEKRRRTTVVKILSWLFRAHRPLKQDEIREAIAVRLGAKTLSKPLLHLDSLIQYCQGLVTMDDVTEIVRFSHFTVKEFLTVHYQTQLLSPIDCAQLCLTYVNFEIFEKGACSNKGQYEKRGNEYRFSEYVAMFWGSYVQGEAEYDQQVVVALWKFFESRKKRAAFRQLYRILSLDPLNQRSGSRKILKVAERFLNSWTPLHTIAHEGLAIFYERYLSNQRLPSVGEWHGEIELGTVRSQNEESETPLLLACARGHVDVAKLLIANGAEVMARDYYGETPLHKAAAAGHKGVIKLLLEKGAEVNATSDHSKWTPLHKASVGGYHEVTTLLLDRGAEINVEDGLHWTPLHRAASKGRHEVVKVLLDRNAEITNAKNEYQWSPLHDSASGGHLEVVKLLLDKDADLVNSTDALGRTPLYEAACGGHIAVAKLLLAKNANVNAKDGDGDTPLHRAALKGDVQVVSLLLDGGAVIHSRNYEGQTPLHKAALGGHHDVVALLQATGADINARDNNGRAALHLAASTGDHEMVTVLLNRHAEIFPDKLGATPLREAASRGREVMNSLLADCNVEKDNFGWVPLQGPSWGLYVAVISQLCQVFPTNHETIESAFTSLAEAFAGDYLFWRTLGNEFLRQHLFTEAIQTFDMFARKFLFRTTSQYDPSVGKFVTIKQLGSNLESLEFHARCQKCGKIVRGFHYKCKRCHWEINFCQNCVQSDWTDHEHTVEDLLQIPSNWPLAPFE
jgi:ankyrin repeat protein